MNSLIMRLILMVVSIMTPALREALCTFAKEFKTKATETDNPWDDVVADLLLAVLQCPEN